MKITLENCQQYNPLELLRLWCRISGNGRVPFELASGYADDILLRSFLQAVQNPENCLMSPYDILCTAQELAGLDQPPIDCSCDSRGQLWILRYESDTSKITSEVRSPVVTSPLIATSIHIHKQPTAAIVSALYTDFDDDDLMQMHFPGLHNEGVALVDRYLKTLNAKLLSDDMGVRYKQMTPEVGAMLSWLLARPQVLPLLRLVSQEVVN